MNFIDFSFKTSILKGLSFKEIFDNSLTGNYIATQNGKILTCNKAFALILGYEKPKELIGRNIIEFFQKAKDRKDLITKLNNQKILEGYIVYLKNKDGNSTLTHL